MAAPRDLVCFSHLRWDFVFQRPQHLMVRAARTMRVTWWEEPVWIEHGAPYVEARPTSDGVLVARPHLPWGDDPDATLRRLLAGFVADRGIVRPVLWFYTPLALAYADGVAGAPVVYDCMDELAAFAGADAALPGREAELLARADLVFTGGRSLFEAKRDRHPSVHEFASGVDVAHFLPARQKLPLPAALQGVATPRAGFYGVLDERLDLDLVAGVAALLPRVQFVLLGPVAKIDPASLPRAPNLHYPGFAAYADLPSHLAHWDVALLPFALNAATRHISPTKTPEYLAAGRPVVSTAVPDVVRAWAGVSGVRIADGAPAFAAAIEAALEEVLPVVAADPLLRRLGWDGIWSRMNALIDAAMPAVP